MANIPCDPLKSQATIDTVELFMRATRGLRGSIERATGRSAQIKDCGRWGVRVIFNRPTATCLTCIADIMRRERHCTICRVDVAVDLHVNSEDEADALTDWLDRHLVLRWRSSKTRKLVIDTTVYWCDQTKGRNIAVYRKHRQTVRLELRFYRAASVRRAGLDDPTALACINPKRLIDHHLTARRLTERHKRKVMRRAGSARMARRARHILDLIDAQNIGRCGTETVSLDFLRVPEQVAVL
jgi:Phage replication protein CRI